MSWRAHRDRRWRRAVAGGFLCGLFLAAVAGSEPVPVSPETLGDGGLYLGGWRYRSGDDPAWADPALDDEAWSMFATELHHGQLPADWQGLGWYRLRLAVDEDLRDVPLAPSPARRIWPPP